MNLNPLSKALLILMVCALAMIAGLNTYTVFHFYQQPLRIIDAKVVNAQVPLGDDVVFQYTAERQALCKIDVDVFVLRMPEQLLMIADRRPAGVFPLGRTSGFARMPTVVFGKELSPGKYVARFFIHSDCGDRLHTIMVPEIEFEVVE
jgi:hypothetical protein